MAYLPELIEEILSRLPVKSLLRFKTASKNWNSLISEDDKFHVKQLSSSSTSNNFIIYHMNWNGYEPVFRYSDIDTCESRKITFPIEITECHLIGSANGFICVSPGGFERCIIWNPCTGEYKNISIASRQNGSGFTRLFGFGYDSVSDDYKILGNCDSQVHIFSLKTNLRKIINSSVRFSPVMRASYSNGALHWYVTDTPHINTVHLANEKISFIELPKEMNLLYRNYPWLPLFDYQGSLCTFDGESIWVMREYANAKSWAKFTTSLPKAPNGISRLGEVVYLTNVGLGFVKSDIQGRIADEDMSKIRNF